MPSCSRRARSCGASPPDTTTAVIVRKASIKSLKELEGKRVAVNVINSTAWLHAVAAARQARRRSHQGSLHRGAVPSDERSAAERPARRDRSGRTVPLGADGDRQRGNRGLALCGDGAQHRHHAIHCAHPVGGEEPRHRGQVRARGGQGRAVRRVQRGRDPRHQPAIHQSQSGAQGQGAAAASSAPRSI